MHLCFSSVLFSFFFFFNDTATTEIYTLSLHDALPICEEREALGGVGDEQASGRRSGVSGVDAAEHGDGTARSEEHTSELQSLTNLVCRLLLEKKKQKKKKSIYTSNNT